MEREESLPGGAAPLMNMRSGFILGLSNARGVIDCVSWRCNIQMSFYFIYSFVHCLTVVDTNRET